MRDGGGGGVVLIDPDSLRRAASRLKGIAGELNSVSFGDDAFPAMPPGVLAVVQEALAAAADTVGPTAPDLEATVVELTRRAFWAEYADAMSSGYVLTGPAAQEFYSYLRDGTLMRYATPDEAAAAGKELALLSQGFRDDQSKLFLMAASLKGVEGSAKGENLNAFCGAFVNQFGAKNVELVPRVIQAMEYGRPIAFGQSTDPLLLRDVARNWTDQKLQTDPLDLIAPLSLALANATVARSLTSSFEDEIADNKDTWSTAALLSTGVFEKSFLLKCFQTGVVQPIADDSRYYSALAMGETAPVDPYALGRFYTDGKGGLPVDTKSIVLDALSRNPEAAAAALNMKSFTSSVMVYDRMGNQVPANDPMTLLYQYGHFDDHGAAFGRAYLATTNDLNGDYDPNRQPPYPGARADATAMTQNALVQMLGNDHDGMSDFKQGLAGDLVRHHIGDLYASAPRLEAFPDAQGVHISGDQSGVANSAVPSGQLQLSPDALVKSIDHLAQNDSALKIFLHGSAAYQGSLIEQNTATLQPADAHPEWTKSVGAFDAAVLGGTGLHNVENFDASSAQHQLVADFFKDAASGVVAIDNPIAAAAVHTGIGSAIDSIYPAPDPRDVQWQNYDLQNAMDNSAQAAVTAGYYQHGLIHEPPPGDILDGTKLKPYGGMADGSDEQTQYISWMNKDPVTHVTGNAVQDIQDALHHYAPNFNP